MILRDYQESDFAFCNGLIKENMNPYFTRYGINWNEEKYRKGIKNTIQKICVQDDGPVGFFQWSERNEQAYINTIQLSKKVRNKGLGTKLMKLIEKECQKRNYDLIRLSVYLNNPAVALYKKLGYEIERVDQFKYLMKKKTESQ